MSDSDENKGKQKEEYRPPLTNSRVHLYILQTFDASSGNNCKLADVVNDVLSGKKVLVK